MNLNEAIQVMTTEITAILGENALSAYLYGSVALDDFKLGWSDIDILVLTKHEISAEQAQRLIELRQILLTKYPGNHYFRSFEGGMLSLEAFINQTSERMVYWGTSGQRITDRYYFDNFCMTELLDCGVLLYGEDVRNRFARPSYGQLRGDVVRHYETIRKYAQKTDKSLYSFGWLLDIARCIYTLRTGKIIAKTAAGEWALENRMCPCADTLKKAVEVRRDPLAARECGEVFKTAEYLGEDIQCFADVLEDEFGRTVKAFAESELSLMSIRYDSISQMQYKDGLSLRQVDQSGTSFVLKCFDKPDHRREIQNYKALSMLGIPTLKLVASTACAILMEDIEASSFRLGTADDLNDMAVATLIANWYKVLHHKGAEYAQTHDLYDECDVLTLENMAVVKRKTATGNCPVWAFIKENFDKIKGIIMRLPRTLTYNDFYYTNLAVAHDGSSALMFDYNFLGKGYVYSDIRNVCSSLGEKAKAAFLSSYGEVDEAEVMADKVASTLTTLYFACEKNSFPSWAQSELEKVKNGELLDALHVLLENEYEKCPTG